METKLFYLLPQNGKAISSTELVALFYGNKRMPVHGRTTMNVSLKRLIDKTDRNREPFKIMRKRAQGVRSIDWQVVKRGRR